MESVERVYNTRLSRFGELKTESLHSLTSVLDAADIKVHVISSRVKTLESVLGKLERQSGSAGVESTLSEPRSDDAVLDSIRDIVGLRVVCLFRSQLADVGKLLSQAFEVLEEDRKTERSDVDHFGYLSDHYICQLSEELRGPRYDHIKKMPFEVQVRTIGMDAWAAVSHHLDYKSDAGVPKNLLKDFYALSGLYFVADTQFAEIYRRAQELRSELQVAVDTKSTSLPSEINVETLYAFLKKRYPDRTTKIEAVEPLIAELQRSDIKSLDQLSHLLDRGHEAFLQLEAEDPPLVGRAGKKGRYLSTGAARVTLDLVVDGYFERRTQKGGGPKRKALIAKYQKLVPA